MTTTTSGVDPRVKRTRQLLMQAFMELLQEKSFTAITIQDITEKATVNRATFYAHFSDKYALMDSLLREQFQAVAAQQLPANPTWDMHTLRALIGVVFNFLGALHRHCPPGSVQFDPLMMRVVQQEIAELLMRWLKLAQGTRMRPSARLDIIAPLLSWAIFGVASQWSYEGQEPSVEEMTKQVLLILTQGVANIEPGLLPG